ncbi:Sec-independent protein translocase subunit TatB [Pseudomonas putida]|uniref:Sec-independent protein translocase protein TatB n=1 Tax=Pseudomonas putida group TaxID=136845 RepID=UPI0018ABF37F|nr:MULTISPECIES: Sec-independent protein translocase protein TatB [Pseudomonas putida group]MBF8649345.1 Sec-independent protein translocase subunit TatB [Pseudomonas putida]MBF8653686.1 Sec-independent protein translocase subunit TatB [Pseudomonas putida]MBF8767553.1 Sec-independent protein translocase subunit TatB [Pseudomonas putida]MEC4025281.1 Sec-independent protein translocase protein TatB [Pseudomonas fulva]
MFGISFGELLLVGLVALLVLGPERLPGAARTAGLWIGRLKRSFNSIKMEVEREIGADDIRRQLHNEHIMHMEEQAKRILNPNAPPAQPPVTTATVQPPAGLPTTPAETDATAPATAHPTPVAPEPPRAP